MKERSDLETQAVPDYSLNIHPDKQHSRPPALPLNLAQLLLLTLNLTYHHQTPTHTLPLGRGDSQDGRVGPVHVADDLGVSADAREEVP